MCVNLAGVLVESMTIELGAVYDVRSSIDPAQDPVDVVSQLEINKNPRNARGRACFKAEISELVGRT